jgi:hypothetical protein
MGRSYCFECSKCGYRATVAGCADGGVSFEVQTIVCRECRDLRDVVTRVKQEPSSGLSKTAAGKRGRRVNRLLTGEAPPSFELVLNRLPPAGAKRLRWVPYEICCPVSPLHRVQAWNDPGRCPRCGTYLDKSALPFRIWE